jgi:hypothetical protein
MELAFGKRENHTERVVISLMDARIKNIWNKLFYTVGTVLVLFFVMVIGVNFLTTSRLFGENYTPVAVETAETPQNPQSEETPQKEDFETILFQAVQRNNQTDTKKEPQKKPVEDKEESSSNGAITKNLGLKVRLYNYSGIPYLHEKLKLNLQNAGFMVDLEPQDNTRRNASLIVQQTQIKDGGKSLLELQKLLKKVMVVEEWTENAEYDYLVVLAEDYLP